jgi:hypothetical protein
VLWGSLFFFAVAFVFVVPMTNMWFIVHMNLLAQLNLTVIALGSMLFKRPFTMDYAKKHVPEALWTHPRFVRKNYIITGVWAVYFILGLITAVVQLDHLPIGKIALEILDDGGMIGAMLFTSIYSKKRSVTAEPTA